MRLRYQRVSIDHDPPTLRARLTTGAPGGGGAAGDASELESEWSDMVHGAGGEARSVLYRGLVGARSTRTRGKLTGQNSRGNTRAAAGERGTDYTLARVLHGCIAPKASQRAREGAR